MVGSPGDAQRIYQLIIDAGGSKAGAEMFKRAADQISESAAKAAAAGKPLNDNVAAAEKAYARLVTRIDPVTTAQTRMAREIEVVQRAFAAQKISVEQAATNLQQITTRYEAAIERARRFGQAGRGMGAAFQQAGFQIGDFAVQVASGQGVLRPLIQQGTQLVSMFGPWGAVIGAAGAALGALATTLIHTEDATKKAKEATKAYTEAMEAAEKITKALHGTSEASVPALQAERRERLRLADAVLSEAQAKITAAEASVQAARTNQILNPSSPEDFGVLGDPVVNALDNLEKIKAAQAEIILQQRKLKAENQFGGEMMDPFAAMGRDNTGDYYKPSPAPEASTFSDNLLRAFNEHAEQARQTVRTVQTEGQKVETVLDGLKKQYDDLTKAPVETRARNLFGDITPSQSQLQQAEGWLKKIDDFNAKQASGKQFSDALLQGFDQHASTARQQVKMLETQQDQVDLLRLQLQLSSANDNEAELALAHLKAQQEVHAQMGNTLDANAQKYIENAEAIARMNQQLRKQQAEAAIIPDFLDRTVDRIGEATTALATQGATWASLRGIAMGVLSEIGQTLLQLSVMNPLKNWISGGDLPTAAGLLGKLFGGGQSNWQSSSGNPHVGGSSGSSFWSNGNWNPLNGITSWFQNLFADGGVMSPRGPVPLRRYAAGGVANSPQMSMFGEGDRPEAYVPLNDGRSIPVTLNGQGGAANRNNGQWGGNVIHYAPVATFQVSGGIDKATEMAMHRVAAAYAKASVEGFKSSINSGGGDAVLVGRRRK